MYNSKQCWVPNTDHELHVLRFQDKFYFTTTWNFFVNCLVFDLGTLLNSPQWKLLFKIVTLYSFLLKYSCF